MKTNLFILPTLILASCGSQPEPVTQEPPKLPESKFTFTETNRTDVPDNSLCIIKDDKTGNRFLVIKFNGKGTAIIPK